MKLRTAWKRIPSESEEWNKKPDRTTAPSLDSNLHIGWVNIFWEYCITSNVNFDFRHYKDEVRFLYLNIHLSQAESQTHRFFLIKVCNIGVSVCKIKIIAFH